MDNMVRLLVILKKEIAQRVQLLARHVCNFLSSFRNMQEDEGYQDSKIFPKFVEDFLKTCMEEITFYYNGNYCIATFVFLSYHMKHGSRSSGCQ